jgi:hypothetical protein
MILKYWKPLATVAAIILAFLFGRYERPAVAVKETTHTIGHSSRASSGSSQATHTITKIKTVKQPSGVVETDEEIDSTSNEEKHAEEAKNDSETVSVKETDTTKEKDWHVSVSVNPTEPKKVKVEVQRRIIGPLSVGVGYDTKNNGVSVSIGVDL